MRDIIIDIETNGLDFNQGHEITEIAAAVVTDGVIISTFSSLINIDGYIGETIEELTGINKKMLEYAPDFELVMIDLIMSLQIMHTNVIMHNVKFDYNFILYWMEKKKIDPRMLKSFLSNNFICSLEMARKLLPEESHKLEDLKKKFGIKTKSHRALNDVLVTNKIYQNLLKIEREKSSK